MAKSFIDVVQDSPRTGLGIPVKTKKKPSLEPIWLNYMVWYKWYKL